MKFFSQWTLIVKGVGLYLQSCGVFLNCKCGLDFSSLEIRYSLVLIMFWLCFLQTIRIFSRRESKTTVWQEINKWKNLWVESQVQQCSSILKFIYSEKATKFCKISTLLLSYIVPIKSKVEILQNCVVFSENINFKNMACLVESQIGLYFA